jgi:hypothetical protein
MANALQFIETNLEENE